MNIDKLMADILEQRTEYYKKHEYDLVLVMNKKSYETLKTWYQCVMTYPITSLIIDKKEYPLNRLYGMDIELRDISEDFIVEVLK